MPFFAFLQSNLRWLFAGYLLTLFSGFGQTFFISLSSGNLRAEFGLSHGDFGLLYMIATLASASVLPWVGRSVDVYPIQRVAAAVVIGLTLCCAMMASVSSVWMLFVVIFGLRLTGQGMMTHISLTAMGRWFSAQRGRAVSLAVLGFPTAEAVFPVSFVAISNAVGWRTSWWIAAAALCLIALPFIFKLLQEDRQPKSPIGAEDGYQGRHWTRREVLRDPVFWAVCAGVLAPPFIGTAVMFHQVYLVELRGWSLELFASAFILMAATSVGSSLVIGGLVDRYSARAMLPVMLLPLSVACFVLSTIHAPVAAFIFMALLGIGNGFTSTLIGALWPEVYGTRHIGAIRSLAFAFMVFSSAAGPGLVGWLIDLGVAYDLQLLSMGCFCIAVSALLVLSAREIRLRSQT